MRIPVPLSLRLPALWRGAPRSGDRRTQAPIKVFPGGWFIMTTFLQVEELSKVFDVGRKRKVHAVNNVSLTIDRGETVALVGESGSGKTTVGNCILNLVKPTSGRVLVEETDVTNLKPSEFRSLAGPSTNGVSGPLRVPQPPYERFDLS